MFQMMKAILIGLISVALITLFCGCKTVTKVVEVEKVRTDTTYITKHQRDSVWMHDSIRVTEKGDIVRIEKWHTKYIEKAVHDTLYQSKRDSIPYPVEVTKEVEKPLTWWQQARLYLANIVLCLLAVVAIVYVDERYLRGK
jgi:hypothetical protein